jgi:hypothetical protein
VASPRDAGLFLRPQEHGAEWRHADLRAPAPFDGVPQVPSGFGGAAGRYWATGFRLEVLMSRELDKIKARLHSIAPSRMATLPKSVQRLLEEDMSRLIQVIEVTGIVLSLAPEGPLGLGRVEVKQGVEL